jgi:hypothetical protein
MEASRSPWSSLNPNNRSQMEAPPSPCHPERSRGTCSSTDLSGKCFSALRSSVAQWRDLRFARVGGPVARRRFRCLSSSRRTVMNTRIKRFVVSLLTLTVVGAAWTMAQQRGSKAAPQRPSGPCDIYAAASARASPPIAPPARFTLLTLARSTRCCANRTVRPLILVSSSPARMPVVMRTLPHRMRFAPAPTAGSRRFTTSPPSTMI